MNQNNAITSNANDHDNNPVRRQMREFVRLAFEATDPKRELEGNEQVADEAYSEYEANREDIESGRMKHISEPTEEGALNGLAREISRERSFSDDGGDDAPMDAESMLDALVQAVRDRRAGK